jgi:RPA family protein|tara:strand:- start:1375 stop:1584 length:210 start_codon:yes stop_codon:yes gene_type:complete
MKLVRLGKDLVKDEETGAILNTNEQEIEKAKKVKEAKEAEKDEIAQLKDDVNELKDMMKQLLEKINNDG